MLRIAICDDDSATVQSNRSIAEDCLKQCGSAGEIARRLPGAICDAIRLIELEEGKFYTIQTNSRLEKIPYKEILFIERDGKNASITTTGGATRVRKSLQQVYEELAAEEFIFIDRGCIVNMIHVMQVKDGSVILKNGVALPVSRSHLQEVKAQLNAYWGRTYDGYSSALRHIDRSGAGSGRPDPHLPVAIDKEARWPKPWVGAGRGDDPHGFAVPAPCTRLLPNGSGSGADCRLCPLDAGCRAENGPVCGYLL